MKYWILTTEYPPNYGGGISTYCYNTANMLNRKGHDVTVFIYDLALANDRISIINGIRIVQFATNRTNSSKFMGFNAYLSYEYASVIEEYILKEGKPAVIESQEYQGIAYYVQQFHLLAYEPFADLKIIITCHAPSFLCLEYNQVPIYQLPDYWIGQMEKSSITNAGLLICPSRYFVKEAKQRMNWDNIREKHLVNPIEVSEDGPIPDFQENYIVCFGKLSPLKGTFELLNYFKLLWDNGFSYPLHIIGGTNQIFHPQAMSMGDLVNLKYKYYIKKGLLKIEGDLTPQKAKEKVLSAQVVLVPSIFDNLPYTVLEAMSWGKVVLTSYQGGQAEIITHGENGFLFDHYKDGDFQEKLQMILSFSKNRVANIGTMARKTIWNHYRPEIVYENKMNLIKEFLTKKETLSSFPFIHSTNECNENNGKKIIGNNLLSVVIPFYNLGEYIEECILSVVNSHYSSKEIIIIDDGSTDISSIDKLKEIKEKYPVQIITKKNEGLAIARNFGAEKGSGDFLAFLDADDTVDPFYYSKAITVLKKYDNVHFIGCWIKYFGGSSQHWPAFNPEPPYILFHNTINSSSLVYKKNSFLKHGLNARELIYGMEDWDSVISMVENNYNGVVLPEPLFNYRVRKDSMARAFTRVKMLYLYKIIGERHKSFFNRYGYELSQLLNTNGCSLYIENPTYETNIARFDAVVNISRQIKEKLKRLAKKNKLTKKIAYAVFKKIKH